MDNRQIARQMIAFNKAVFDNSFAVMKMVAGQNEKKIETFFTQATWLPEEGREALRTWVSAYRTGCNDFKKLMEDNYARADVFFDND